MNWLDRWACHRAAKRFARRLPASLSRKYSPGKLYTPGQIEKVLSDLRLNGRFVAIAYAAFLTEADYVRQVGRYPVVLPYDSARSLFKRYSPLTSSAFEPAPETAIGP
jgi:hypothetical protein